MIVFQSSKPFFRLFGSIVTQPPVEVQVLHVYRITIQVVALQVKGNGRYLSLADHIVVCSLRLLQTKDGIRRFDPEHAGLTTLRTNVESIINITFEIRNFSIRRDDIIVRIRLPRQLRIVAIKDQDTIAKLIEGSENGFFPVNSVLERI